MAEERKIEKNKFFKMKKSYSSPIIKVKIVNTVSIVCSSGSDSTSFSSGSQYGQSSTYSSRNTSAKPSSNHYKDSPRHEKTEKRLYK